MDLDPLSLKLFAAVIEHGSIAGAAERHHIAAAAVSKRMSELEALLRTALLKRTNKGVEATPAGFALLGHAHRLLRDMDEIFVEMRDWADGVRGQVRVCANISAITQFLPREIAQFLRRYPEAQIRLQERISTAIVKQVLQNEADVGIGVVDVLPAGLESYPYRSDQLVVITPSVHPLAGRAQVAFADTLAYDYVGLHTGSAINLQLARASMEAERDLRIRIQVTSYDALSRMVEAGLGIGVMPAQVAAQYSASLGIRAIALEDAWRERELRLVVRSYAALPPTARLLVDSLRGGEAGDTRVQA
ncbi:MAG: LysR family transcriptional regulator [Burkholderiales bacterium]